MEFIDLITKKRHDLELNENEFQFLIGGYICREISDCQMAAFLTTMSMKPYQPQELASLLKAIVGFSKQLKIQPKNRNKILLDKHSFGIGDKLSFILVPILVALGFDVARFSGTGLSYIQGNLKKIHAIGVREKNQKSFQELIDQFHFFDAPNFADYSPVGERLKHLQEQIGALNDHMLITTGILARKVIINTDYILIDLKIGGDNFCSNFKEGLKLAQLITKIMAYFPQKAIVTMTRMVQPIGRMIGTQNEFLEAIWFLEGDPRVSNDLKKIVEEFCTNIMLETKMAANLREARHRYMCAIDSRRALKIMLDYYLDQITEPEQRIKLIKRTFWEPKYKVSIPALEPGFVTFHSNKTFGLVNQKLARLGTTFDYSAGIEILKKWGEHVHTGDPVINLYANEPIPDEIVEQMKQNVQINPRKPESEHRSPVFFPKFKLG